ncbi:SPTBN5 [Cordylochernes scorpioides]|uniref:SPTBN5 n=1 Tax=Cordylochernes scorpioides TaxID=51811 RepID=A0ABY6JWS3_9ARAC|nr:SPTBN5 [Cordylochernes scorpioides]
MLLLVRNCLLARVILLVSQLAFISEGHSPIRHHGCLTVGIPCVQLTSLQEHGIKLLQQNHFESELIRRRLDEVIARMLGTDGPASGSSALSRRHKLADALLYSQFIRDSTEASAWLREKQKKLEAADQATSSADPATLEEKMKKLQKHQAFQSELSAPCFKHQCYQTERRAATEQAARSQHRREAAVGQPAEPMGQPAGERQQREAEA